MNAERPRMLLVKMFAPYPLDRGSNILTYNLVKALAEEFDIVMLAGRPQQQEEFIRANLLRVCREVHFCDAPNLKNNVARWSYAARSRVASLLTGRPPAAYYADLLLREPLRELLARETFDLIQIDYWNLAELADLFPARTPSLMLLHDFQSYFYTREAEHSNAIKAALMRRMGAKTSAFERRTLPKFDYLATVTDVDAGLYRKMLGDARPVVTAPVIFGMDDVTPMPDPNNHKMVFIGAMNYRPNSDAIRYFSAEIMPKIRDEISDAELLIVGSNPPRDILAMDGRGGITVTGTVPDVRPYMEQASVYVAPLRFGSGIKLKILEAMAFGKAIVTTGIGAEGIDIRNGEGCMIADEAGDFARTTVTLLRQPELRLKMAATCRRSIWANHSFECAGPRLRELYRGFIGKG
jgi:polysaccharide biosynthesis protein PslH